MRLKQIPRHGTTKFHVTTPRHVTIRLRQIVRYDSAKIRDTSQRNVTIRLSEISRNDATTTPPNFTIQLNNKYKFHDTTYTVTQIQDMT